MKHSHITWIGDATSCRGGWVIVRVNPVYLSFSTFAKMFSHIRDLFSAAYRQNCVGWDIIALLNPAHALLQNGFYPPGFSEP